MGPRQAMYDQSSWGALTEPARGQGGQWRALMALADDYAGGPGGGLHEQHHGGDAGGQLPRPPRGARSRHLRELRQGVRRGGPTWGETLAWGGLPCGVWPAKAGSGPHTISAEGSGPIVVVGTTRDPATIYEWSKRLKDQLSNAVLVSYDGDGHTAYRRSNACVDTAIDAYYVQGRVPKDGLTC